MTDDFRLDRYLTRIGFEGVPRADHATLSALHAAHVRTIPFEGIDPLLGRPVKLDLASVQEKLVDTRRGGYCFEQNTLFKAALEQIGFRVTGLGGRVRWMSPPDSPLGPRTHMAIKVDLEGVSYLTDVGFGACVLDAPLLLRVGVEQRSATGTFRLTEVDGMFYLNAKQPDGWRVMYAFNLEPQLPSDYEVGNWYTSTNPQAPFMHVLIMERIGHDGRHKLLNRRLTIEARDGEVTMEREIGSAEEFARVLDESFGVTPPVPIEQLFTRTGR